jgi:NADP-dependent 3-hydroxy acid dehydrogenase YdfG
MNVAIITGASQGLGLATARALTSRGWAVAIDARREGPLRQAAAELPAGQVAAVPGDVTDPGHRAALVAAARALGPVTLLINNASALSTRSTCWPHWR